MHRRRRRVLVQEQQQLLQRNAELRVALSLQSQVLKPTLALADQLRAGLQWLGRHPVGPMLALALLLLKRPSRTLRGLSRVVLIAQLLSRGWHGLRGLWTRQVAR
ncbi:membrane protein [Hylemonella gracilis str. Niagara R]|uniref:Membrane protein n=1 Tax=Hylemonella gracilis str. Niagara R TaxID=1458275 RepID=A0A016XG23_9BURK|nr:YqjK family protein [Hylemonella gracilis]EYC50502.1 membrane protein [Hylemonella gracilis str. Niagara R]